MFSRSKPQDTSSSTSPSTSPSTETGKDMDKTLTPSTRSGEPGWEEALSTQGIDTLDDLVAWIEARS